MQDVKAKETTGRAIAASPPLRVDIHAHIVDRHWMEQLVTRMGLVAERTTDGKTLFRQGNSTVAWTREDMFDIDFRLREMDRKGIDARVLSVSTPNVYAWKGDAAVSMARAVNDATARLCRAHPDRFFGLASLPLDDVEASLVELERATAELGMKGVMIGSNIDGLAVNDARFEPVWAEINRRRLAVFEHPMFPRDTSDMKEFELPLRVGFVFDTTLAATRLIYGGVFERYPDFPYILAHTGGALLMVLARLDNGYRLFPDCRKFISKLPSEYAKSLYYDTTSFDTQAIDWALRVAGPEHVLFGTDDPYINADTSLIDGMPLDAETKALVLGGNAARLLGLT